MCEAEGKEEVMATDDEFRDIMNKVSEFYRASNGGLVGGWIGTKKMEIQAARDTRSADAFSTSMQARRQVLRDMVVTAEAVVKAKAAMFAASQESWEV